VTDTVAVMRSRGLAITAAALGVIGLVLVVIESIEALRSVVLSTLDASLLYVGLGACVIAAVLTLANADDPGPAPRQAPADKAGTETA
jgi:hypothetical protein